MCIGKCASVAGSQPFFFAFKLTFSLDTKQIFISIDFPVKNKTVSPQNKTSAFRQVIDNIIEYSLQ